jgi:hypothetical protein
MLAACRREHAARARRSKGDCRHSCNETLWKCCLGQSAFAPENLTTLAHLSVSSATNFRNSATVIGIGSAPSSANRAVILASVSPALISWFSF